MAVIDDMQTADGNDSIGSEMIRRRKATIREVAQAAGVGVGTVSRVLNGSGAVAEATAERVRAAIVALGFNTVRPHGSLGYKPPAPEVFVPAMTARAALQSQPAPPPALASRPTMH